MHAFMHAPRCQTCFHPPPPQAFLLGPCFAVVRLSSRHHTRDHNRHGWLVLLQEALAGGRELMGRTFPSCMIRSRAEALARLSSPV
jgi:hypothetical protein